MDNGASSYRRFLNGDENAINEIVDEYCDGLILYINSIVKNISAAENLAQDTFVKLLMKKPKNNFKSGFKTWLYTIGGNTALDYLRKESKGHTIPLDEVYADLQDEKNLEESYIKESDKLAVHKALKNIKSEYAQILWLTYFEGMSNKEAAEIMKKSVRSIENLVSRARKALKEELTKEGFEYENP